MILSNMTKKTICFVSVFLTTLIFTTLFAQDARVHRVMPGETLYSLTKRYGVTEEAFKAANPSIVGSHLVTGMQLIVPSAVQQDSIGHDNEAGLPKDTLSAQKSSSEELTTIEHLSTPKQEEARDSSVSDFTLAGLPKISNINWPQLSSPLRIAIILPFYLDGKSENEQKLRMRYVEFYQGLLLAVDDAQKEGAEVELQVYDCGSESLDRILNNPSLETVDLIIAPKDGNEVRKVAEYGEQRGINVVSPFSFEGNFVGKYGRLFQLNTSKTMLYEQLSKDVVDRFSNHTIVFLTDSMELERKEDFVDFLQAKLDQTDRDYFEYGYTDAADVGVVDSVLQLEGDVLYIPYTSNQAALRRIFPYLQYVQTNKGDTIHTSVLGYPEWQLYMEEFLDYYYSLDLYMFTKIYVNPFEDDVKDFYNRFKGWYGKEPMPIYPKYALLGYDIGKYFLTALSRYGKGFEVYVNELSEVKTLQNIMYYQGEYGKGYINKGLFLVHFSPEVTIEKIVIK